MKCNECGMLFEELKTYTVDCTPGFGSESSFYSKEKGCPFCRSTDYEETIFCDNCYREIGKSEAIEKGRYKICEKCENKKRKRVRIKSEENNY